VPNFPAGLFRRLLLAPLLVAGSSAALGAQAPRIYLTNQDDASVAILEADTNTLLETLDLRTLGFAPSARPHHAQVEHDGSFWYVTLIGAGQVLKLDRANRVVGSVAMAVPGLMALSPSADLLLVARSMSAVNPPSRLAVIRRSDMTLLDEVEVVVPRPHAIALDPRGRYAYVASLGVNQLASVRLADGATTVQDVPGPYHTLAQFSVSPDGRWLVATGSTSAQLLVFDISTEGRPVLARTVAVEKGPFETIFTLDGSRLFVTNLDANVVSIVDPATWTVRQVLHGPFQQPHGLAVAPDGQVVWVSNRHQSGGAHQHEGMQATATGTAVALCAADGRVLAEIAVGHYAAGIGAPAPLVAPGPPRPCR
jgi:YVTN family beta-propeller protein